MNKADQAALDGVKGIGPGIATKILDERKEGPVQGLGRLRRPREGRGRSNAAKFSAEGLTVNGAAFSGAAPAAKKDAKPAAAKKEEAKAAAAPAATTKKETAPVAAAAAPAPAAKAEAKLGGCQGRGQA